MVKKISLIDELNAKDHELETRIQQSNLLLDLEYNWGGEGEKRILKDTLDKATQLLTQITDFTRNHFPLPDIGPCSDGSIDLYWKDQDLDFSLLINVKKQATTAECYGECNGSIIKETIDLIKPNLEFLVRIVVNYVGKQQEINKNVV